MIEESEKKLLNFVVFTHEELFYCVFLTYCILVSYDVYFVVFCGTGHALLAPKYLTASFLCGEKRGRPY